VKSYRDIQRISADTPEGRDELEALCRDWLQHLQQQKWVKAIQWFENASFLLGNHTTQFFYSQSQGFGINVFGASPQSSYDSLIAKCADNRLVRPVETVIGMLTDSDPTVRATANSEDPGDIDAYRVSEIVLDLLLERPVNLAQRRRELGLLAALTGSAYPESEYGEIDYPSEVPKTKVVTKDNPLYDPEDDRFGPEKISEEVEDGTQTVNARDARVRVWSSFNIDPDPGATSLEDMVWIARTTFEDIGWIKEQYGDGKESEGFFPENLKDIASVPASGHPLYWWSKFQDILESPQAFSGGMTNTLEDSGNNTNQTTFSVIDVRPCKEYPQGRTLVLAGGKMIYAGISRAWTPKYKERWHKYGKFDWFKMPGRFQGVALLSLLVPLQKRINAIDALVQANRQNMSIGQWLLPDHSKVRDGVISGIPGKHVSYRAQVGLSNPEKVKHEGLPAELLAERAQLIAAINDIASAMIIDNDQVSASAARAGAIFEFLRAEKLRSKAPMLKDFEQTLENVGQNLLIDVQIALASGDEELAIRISNAAREVAMSAIQAFATLSLRDHNAIKIDVTSELRRTPEALEQKALEFFQFAAQSITPGERNAVMSAIGLDRHMKNQQDASIDRARRMIARARGAGIDAFLPMQGVDDPAVMAPEFQREILSEKFLEYAPEIQEAFFQIFDYYASEASRVAMDAEKKMLEHTAAMSQAEAAGEAIKPKKAAA
jgi:hypothetical protein